MQLRFGQKGSAGLMASARPLPTGVASGHQSERVGRPDGISPTPDRPARSDDDAVAYDVLLLFFIRIRSDGCLQPTEIQSSAEASGLQAC